MVVATGDERGPGGAAESRGVEAVVPQPILGQPGERRCLARATEGAGRAKADVVEQHEQDIRRAGRGLERLREVGLRVLGPQIDGPLERGGWEGQDGPSRGDLLRSTFFGEHLGQSARGRQPAKHGAGRQCKHGQGRSRTHGVSPPQMTAAAASEFRDRLWPTLRVGITKNRRGVTFGEPRGPCFREK